MDRGKGSFIAQNMFKGVSSGPYTYHVTINLLDIRESNFKLKINK